MPPVALDTASDGDDQRVYLHDLSYGDYQHLLRLRGDAHTPRLTYFGGVLELMRPSTGRESTANSITLLIEAWAEASRVDLQRFESRTLTSATSERGIEPDAGYVLGRERPPVPDLVLEVTWTSGGPDPLEVYRALGVKEVWLWTDYRLTIHRASGSRWLRGRQSTVIPDLDLDILERHLSPGRQTMSAKAYRADLRRR